MKFFNFIDYFVNIHASAASGFQKILSANFNNCFLKVGYMGWKYYFSLFAGLID